MKDHFSILATILVVVFTIMCVSVVRVARIQNSQALMPTASVQVANIVDIAEAQSSQTQSTIANAGNITGWAWSSNIGWIKLDGVKVDATGSINGYAWSSNIGWIKFGGLSSYPTNGSIRAPAKIDLASGRVTGWTRACGGTASGDCTSMDSRTDGWDGWIELSGIKHETNSNGDTGAPATDNTTGVKMDAKTGHITGMAWGGDVVGWLSFDAHLALGSTNTPCNGGPVNPDGTCGGGSTTPPGGGNPNRDPLNESTLQDSDLYIGRSGPTANLTSLTIKHGETFGLKWKNTHGPRFTCTASSVAPDSLSFNGWSGGNTIPPNADSNITYDSSATAKAPTGVYSFKIVCDNGDVAARDVDIVTLKISGTVREWER